MTIWYGYIAGRLLPESIPTDLSLSLSLSLSLFQGPPEPEAVEASSGGGQEPPKPEAVEAASGDGEVEKPAPSKDTGPSDEASKSEASSAGAIALEEQPKPKENGDEGKPEYSVGDDGRPRQRILTEQGMLLPAG